MKKFKTPPRPAQRRQSRPTARDLVIGHDNAKDINRGKATLHLRPVRAGDHIKRYKPDQTLNVRAFVGGPTWCKITVTEAFRVPLDQALTLANAMRAGYRTSTELAEAFERSYGQGRSDRMVWVLVFKLDATERPRLLAASGDAPSRYKLGADGRWQHVERHDERDTDRGYTDIQSRALRNEMPALSDDDWKRHVDRTKDLTHGQWVALDHARQQDAIQRAHADRGRNMRRAA